MHEAFIQAIPLIPSNTKLKISDRTRFDSQDVPTRMSTRRTHPSSSTSRRLRVINEKIDKERINPTITTNLPQSPAEWLHANQSSLKFKTTSSLFNPTAQEVASTIPTKSPTTHTIKSTGASLRSSGIYFSSSSRWLYASPPSYCNVGTDVIEMQRILEKRTFYLGPVMRNKIVRAVQLARETVKFNTKLESTFVNNVTVALIVADLQMDCDTICAAILHDLVEREGFERKLVEKDVGSDVLRILDYHAHVVESVNLCVDNEFTELSFSNLRGLILVGAEEEPRAISLELARAILAMRTVDKLPDEESRVLVARRAMYLYAPLAYQLGIWFIQGELEELAFMYLHPESFHMIRHLVGERRRECESTLGESKQFLERILSKTPEIRSQVQSVLVRGRVKGLYSVYSKMRRSGRKVNEIYDLLALRVIVQPKKADEASEQAVCYAVADVIKRHYETFEIRAKDYISNPKRNGYRSLHMTVLPQGETTPLEIQIRTEKMHHVAEFGAAAHWIYKEKLAEEEAKNKSSSSFSSNDLDQMADNNNLSAEFNKCKISTNDVYTCEPLPRLAHPNSTSTRYRRPRVPVTGHKASTVSSAVLSNGIGLDAAPDRLRQGYVTCIASAIRTSRVIVAAAGQLYGLAVGSTLLDLVNGLGMASINMSAMVNGLDAPLTQRLEMNDIIRFIQAFPET